MVSLLVFSCVLTVWMCLRMNWPVGRWRFLCLLISAGEHNSVYACVCFKLYSQQWAVQADPVCYILLFLINALALSQAAMTHVEYVFICSLNPWFFFCSSIFCLLIYVPLFPPLFHLFSLLSLSPFTCDVFLKASEGFDYILYYTLYHNRGHMLTVA